MGDVVGDRVSGLHNWEQIVGHIMGTHGVGDMMVYTVSREGPEGRTCSET